MYCIHTHNLAYYVWCFSDFPYHSTTPRLSVVSTSALHDWQQTPLSLLSLVYARNAIHSPLSMIVRLKGGRGWWSSGNGSKCAFDDPTPHYDGYPVAVHFRDGPSKWPSYPSGHRVPFCGEGMGRDPICVEKRSEKRGNYETGCKGCPNDCWFPEWSVVEIDGLSMHGLFL